MQDLAPLQEKWEFLLRSLRLLQTSDVTLASSYALQNVLNASLNTIVETAKRIHVDASPLHQQLPPPSLKQHHSLHPTDKIIWDRAYLNEYLGLHEDTEAWEYI